MSAEVQLEFFQVENQGQEFVVSWKSLIEEDIRVFELTHRTALSSGRTICQGIYTRSSRDKQAVFIPR